MRRYILICASVVMLLVGGCNFFRAPGKDSCSKIISKQKMVDLLSDIYLMEAFLQSEKMGSPHYEDTVMHYYAGLFQRHGVSREVFSEALSCYLLYETEIQEIHEEIMQGLSMLDSELSYAAAGAGQHTPDMPGDTLHVWDTIAKEYEFPEDYIWWHTAAAYAMPYIAGGTHAMTMTDSLSTVHNTNASAPGIPEGQSGTDSLIPQGLLPPVAQ